MVLVYYSYIRCHPLGSRGQRHSFLGLFPKSMGEVFFVFFFIPQISEFFKRSLFHRNSEYNGGCQELGKRGDLGQRVHISSYKKNKF